MQLTKEHIAKGQKLTLDLTSWGRLGEAMAGYEGLDVFVFGGIPGERVVAEVVRVHRKYMAARVVEVLEPSQHRVEPPCPYFGDCTGCQWQHLDYPQQLDAKRAKVVDALHRVGQFADPPVAPVLASDQEYGYRNHARFTVGLGGALGFVNRETRRFVEVNECQIMHGEVNHHLAGLQRNCAETTQLSIRAGKETGEFLVQPRLALPQVPIATGQGSYTDTVDGTAFRVSSPSFFQVNVEQAAKVVQVVRHCLELTPDDVLVDAYTGVGVFAVLLAPHVKKVIAVEESSAAIADARYNISGIDNVELILGKTEDVLHRLGYKPDAMVLDPPRVGCRPEALTGLSRLATPRVAYVSCDAETLARDLRLLCDDGYRLKEIVPLDMFPQTHHVECVAILEHHREPVPGPLVLASSSPRRRELLQDLGMQFQVEHPAINEVMRPGEGPLEAVERFSEEKARAVAVGRDSGYVIGADSMVVFEDRAMGKPADREEARRMLRELRGSRHRVITAVTIIDATSGRCVSDSMTSHVTLREFTDAEIETSVASGTPLDKAGAYAVQDETLRPAESWEGCYYNIVGLPVCRLLAMLEGLGCGVPAGASLALRQRCGPGCNVDIRRYS